jgi:hypothetical protein
MGRTKTWAGDGGTRPVLAGGWGPVTDLAGELSEIRVILPAQLRATLGFQSLMHTV